MSQSYSTKHPVIATRLRYLETSESLSAMMYKFCITLVSCLLTVASKQWFPASMPVNESGDQFSFVHDNYKQFTTNFTQVTIIQQNPKKPSKNSSKPKYTLLGKNQPIFQAEPMFVTENILFKNTTKSKPTITKRYNNTINNVNIIKKVQPRPKRRYLKRCPATKIKKKVQNGRSQRFLEVFEVVEFDHVVCTSSTGLEGVCLPEQHCRASPVGTCADGYGICCVTQFSCDGVTKAVRGWFVNPGFPNPSTERLSCPVTINKASTKIQQIRLDFFNFELLPPTAGTCERDQFVVSGQNVNSAIPILCGINTGQHIYVEVGDVDGPITLSVQTVSAEKRLFAIKVTQLTAFDVTAAPTGCLQYFKGATGYIESFNFMDKSDIGIARYPSYLNNLNYAMCIERATHSCSVTYTNEDYFQIVNYDTDGLPVLPPGQAGVEIFNCPTDWLLISAVRLCGDRLNDGSVLQDFALNAPVTDISAGPVVVWFRSDGGYVGRGFKLKYQQNLC